MAVKQALDCMATDALEFGIRPPNWVSQDETFQEITEWVVRAEELGFDSVHTGEQLLAKIPPYESTVYDQQVTMSMWAAETEAVDIGSLIKVMPLMNPIHVAKIYGTLDLAAAGRTILGVGNGYKQHEFDSLGIPKRERGQRTEEGVEIVKRLWTEDHVDYDGDIFQFEDVTIEPKPVADPHPPVWFGATLEEFTPGVVNLHERVGRLGDGWVPMPYSNTDREMLDPADLGRAWEIVEESAVEHGRDPDDIEIVYSHWAYVLDEAKEDLDRCKEVLGNWFAGDWEEANATYPIGTAEEVVETVTHMASELPRVDRFIFTPFDFNEAVPERIANDVRPMLEDRFG
jgi:probable F420-dependent oxidoreductase